ncbi:methyltransferase TYW3-domain-containing protein [Mariannaea sp. PMI_226]|nr:methyltransferase TYW3-domain-containing protein [Mariannaea sp. PMI_226]
MPATITQSSSQSSFQDIKDECESGYVSGRSSEYSSPTSSTILPKVSLTKAHVAHLNDMLEPMHPMDILRFCKVMFPNLYQSTAFGLTGLATMDMLSKIQKDQPNSPTVQLIFLDTLYHFDETHDLIKRVQERYPEVPVNIFKPDGVDSVEQFEETYGKEMYMHSSEMYDWIVKVEPLQRAYEELKVAAVLNGRRRSQGAARGSIPIIELDDERGVVKINPMATWSFKQVNEYIKENNVPYNSLLDQGYKSVGDWHSTVPVGEGEDERAGRWKGQNKTECGIHNKKSRYAEFLAEMDRQEKEKLTSALDKVALGQTVSRVTALTNLDIHLPTMQGLAATAPAFVEKKRRILDQLAVPVADYNDASPKGSVDEGIRDLIDEINETAGFVTTSSCAGRVSVFLEGRRVADAETEDSQVAGVGGKGAGGTWLFVSHDPVPEQDENGDKDWSSIFGLAEPGHSQKTTEMTKERRLVHFKFEAMILHVLAASPEHAQLLLRCGLQAGFRESGALNLLPNGKDAATPMVAIRSMGLAFESLVGQQVDGQCQRLVTPEYLQTLIRIANERFVENTKRIERFRTAFRDAVTSQDERGSGLRD